MVGMYAHTTFNLNPRPRRSTRRCTASCPAGMSTTCTPTRSSRSPPRPRCEAADAGDLRRRDGLRAVDAPGIRARPAPCRRSPRRQPQRPRDHDGPARVHLLGDDDQECYARTLGPDRTGRRLHRGELCGQGRRRRGLRRRKIPDAWPPTSAGRSWPRSCPGCAARFPRRSASSAPCRTTRRSCASSTPQDAAAPGRTRHLLPRPFPAHQDQAAVRRLEPADGGRRRAEEEADAPGWSPTARITPPITRSAGTPNSPAMRDPNPTVILIPGLGMVAWGKDKSRVARHRRILQLRRRGHARRRGDRPLCRPAAAGGLRHRILASGGGQAAADAGRKGARPPGGHRRSAPAPASARRPPSAWSRKAPTSSAPT